MLGRLNPAPRQVTVVGGGAAGLFCSYALLQAGWEVELYEATAQLGGMIGTAQTTFGPAELAAHSFRSGGVLERWCADLGVALSPAQHRQKYIWRAGALRQMPLRPLELLQALGRALSVPGAAAPSTLAAWGNRHLGPAATATLLTPLARGIYGADPTELDQQLAFPALTLAPGQRLLSKLGGPKRRGPRPQLLAPVDGMGALMTALATHVQAHPRATVRLSHPLTTLPQAPNQILATPPAITAQLLATAPEHPPTVAALHAIRFVPLVCVTAFLSPGPRPFPPGIGVLAAADEALGCTGVLFNSSALPQRVSARQAELHSFTFMYGGDLGTRLLHAPNEELNTQVMRDAMQLFGPGVTLHHLHAAHWEHALPRYDATLAAALKTAASGWAAMPGRVLAGNWTGQISLRGMAEDAHALLSLSQET